MIITQAHIDFYRARKVPAASLQARVKPKSTFLARLARETPRVWVIDQLINSQVAHARTGATEPHNILAFIRGWRARGENVFYELYRLAYKPYATDPKRRTAYARRWHARLAKELAK